MLPNLTDEEEAQMKRMFRRVDALAKRALELNVRLMIDAEQTYFQPAISRITMEMMRKYNKDKTIIMNTYQGYLKVRLVPVCSCSYVYTFDTLKSNRSDKTLCVNGLFC